jgi:hypothetical protein
LVGLGIDVVEKEDGKFGGSRKAKTEFVATLVDVIV